MTNHFARYWKIPLVLLFAFMLKATLLFAQIEVEPAVTAPFTPTSLIENVFLGDGIQITNIQFNGKPEAVGYFSNGMADIGFQDGLLLTTGESFQADKANVKESFGGVNQSTAVSAELESIADSELHDVLEYVITFIPTTDSIEFKYRFASEEYPEFGFDCFHDVFGFYIYGPGIAPTGQNMAIVPGTNLPVSVKTIHPFDPDPDNGANCPPQPPGMPMNEHLYIDNSNSPNLEYDGFTQTLYARGKVIPCQEYTLKLVIADVHDGLYDSAVFLESRSFNSSNFEVNVASVGLDGSIVEGCSTADLVFNIPIARTEDYTINFSKIGSATTGIDFEDFPDFVTIPAGELSTSFSIEALADQTVEPGDSIGIEIEIAACLSDTIWIPIKDAQLALPALGEDLTICNGDSIQLLAPVTNQFDSLITFEALGINEVIREVQEDRSMPINDTASFFPLTVTGITTSEVIPGLIHSVCVNINHTKVQEVDIFLLAPSGKFIELSTDNGGLDDHYQNTCFTPTATTPIQAGVAPFLGDFLPEGDFDFLNGEQVNEVWTLMVRDDDGIGGTGNIKGTMLNWSINFNADYQVTYAWEASDSLSCLDCLDPIVFPSQTSEYTLSAIDSYGCTANDHIRVNVQQPLVAPIPTCQEVSTSSVTIGWEAVIGAVDYSVNINENGWEAANSGNLEHKITDLQEGESLAIQVRANSDGICASSVEIISCETMLCAIPPFQLDSINNVSCTAGLDGQIHVSAATDAFFILGSDTSELGQTAIFNQLPANTYKIQVLAASKLCRDTLTATIGEPNNLALQITESRALTCFGANDGSISTLATGGTAPYHYNWSNLTDSTLSFNTTNTLNNLSPGEYRILVTDANNCEAQQFLPIPAPQAIIIDSASLDETCFAIADGSASVSVNPNFNNLNFLWNNGASTAAIDNLANGLYTVSVTNEAGCEEVRQFDITSAAEIILSEAAITPISCHGENDGIASILATGGSGTLSFQWNDALTQTTSTANQLIANDYEVVVTDEIGCTQRLTVTVPDVPPITFDTLTRSISCFGATNGAISLGVEGGTPSYNFSWDDNPTLNIPNRANLAPGNYQLTVNDFNGCSAVFDFTIADKAPINLITNQTPANCGVADGVIVIGVIEGNSAYTFSWADDPTRTTAIATNLTQGDYAVTVFDAMGCSSTSNITLTEKEGINLVTSATSISCAEELGSATVVATGGSGTYNYLWDDAAAQDNPTAQNLAAGAYMVLVVDNNGCESEMSVTVVDNSIPVDINFDKKDISCFGINDGQITAIINSPSNNLQYQWSTGETATTLANLSANTYQLSITDENDCIHEAAITITEPDELFAETMLDPITCPNRGDAVLTILPMGGTPPYLFSENGRRFATTNEFFNLIPANYEPAIRDANNCTVAIPPIVVAEALPLSIDLEHLTLKAEIPQAITPIINNGNGALTYTWSGNNLDDLSCTDCPSPIITPTNTQIYRLNVVDENGCAAETAVRVLVEKNRNVYVPTGFSPNGDGSNDRLTVHGIEGMEIVSFKIFDRWGELIFVNGTFEANDASAGWDGYYKGKLMSTNVFAWIVEARFSDGTVILEKGHSTLIR